MFEPIKAPWIRAGVVLHEAGAPVEDLLETFATTLRERGFRIAGSVRRPREGTLAVADLASAGVAIAETVPHAHRMAAGSLRRALREDVDLVVLSPFDAFEGATREMMATLGEGSGQGMPILTALPATELPRWLDFAGSRGAILPPTPAALWQWWGPERLYADLAQGVEDDEVRRIVCGPRWLMVQGPCGVGLAHLSGAPRDLPARLAPMRRRSLRQLAALHQAWDPIDMALAVAAINAHANRFDLDTGPGNGADTLAGLPGRTVVMGAFPGLAEILPDAQVIEANPRPGEFPLSAADALLPGCAGLVLAASTLLNRSLPRLLRLAQGAQVALVGPGTPLSPRLHAYGVGCLGGLVVRDPDGLAQAIQAGALPREFARFGEYRHLRPPAAPAAPACRARAGTPR
ncbi:Rossmann-like domain-containing protein [Pararhodospirillum oryzae]|uniref:Uncharacterized protein n=1 Tax=Pararhodospirillum oryzae TaxID=478448 RepID=A0A512H5B8_9PROT|nr:DUF364 domain-containing protein [Pararhodospirillum oryzae]GEO80675.1 hypothetical protein ROR02_08060 [Pararhodospirillum oryzae]